MTSYNNCALNWKDARIKRIDILRWHKANISENIVDQFFSIEIMRHNSHTDEIYFVILAAVSSNLTLENLSASAKSCHVIVAIAEAEPCWALRKIANL